jgi:DNA-binding YbaB/EbfC family protein
MADEFAKLPEGMGQKLEDLQQRLLAAQDELAKATVVGMADDGAVNVTITGDQRCTNVEISPETLAKGDIDLLQDLVQIAVNNALDDSRNLAADYLSPLSPNLKPD